MKRTRAATWRTAAALGMTVFVGGTCFAQVNQTPLAIPAGGTQGQASLYPSTLTATPAERTFTRLEEVTLFKVTHPCPKDLAVFLVHLDGDHERLLLMSNAGGCQPLQGTDITFFRAPTPPTREIPPTPPPPMILLPENPAPDAPPHGPSLRIHPSNYGTAPVFPGAPLPDTSDFNHRSATECRRRSRGHLREHP